jgi:hypothetical protein
MTAQVVRLGVIELESPRARTPTTQGANLDRATQAPFVHLQLGSESLQLSGPPWHSLSLALSYDRYRLSAIVLRSIAVSQLLS